MIAPFARIRRTTPAEWALLAEAVLALASSSFLIAVMPFRRVAALVSAPSGAATGAESRERIRAVRWAVAASARRVPWRAKCIEQGFAAQWMLARRGVPAILHYGVARRDGELVAHVWVRSGTSDVIGCENFSDFAEMARFPSATAN